MAEYIEREALLRKAQLACMIALTDEDPGLYPDVDFSDSFAVDCDDICELPAADVVSRAAFDQVMWERDTAIQQLREDYGVGLGEKKAADVVEAKRGRCQYCSPNDCAGLKWDFEDIEVSVTLQGGVLTIFNQYGDEAEMPINFCPNCGADMREVREE